MSSFFQYLILGLGSAGIYVLLAQGLGAELQARRLTFSVDLVRALGGGYVPPAG